MDDKNISYAEYLAEQLGKQIAYSEYLANQISNSVSYSEYLAESLGYESPEMKAKRVRDMRKKKLERIFK